MAAAMRRTFMGCSLYFPTYTTAAATTPSVSGVALKSVRLAGLRRMQPIVPDRTAFRAPIERKTHGDHAEDQCQSPEHDTLLSHAPPYRPKSGIFKPRRPCLNVSSNNP